jgi:hypothetical protein
VVVEHLNHLGIVAEVCREIGVAEWDHLASGTFDAPILSNLPEQALLRGSLGCNRESLRHLPATAV